MCTKHYRIVSYALFANEGEPEQSADFLARVRENKVDFLDFMVPGAWGTIWGTTWFEVRGRIDRESVKGRAVELVVDLGWKRHRGPGFQAEGLCYRPDGSVIKDEDPDFTYAMSSAQQYAWMEQEHPDLFARMLQRIKEGRFIPVGGMWVESDNMLPTGESLIRQITFGMRYFREHLGVEPKGLWLPDSFGYCGAWPQIARRAGFEWFLTQKISWNDTTKFPHHSFEWG